LGTCPRYSNTALGTNALSLRRIALSIGNGRISSGRRSWECRATLWNAPLRIHRPTARRRPFWRGSRIGTALRLSTKAVDRFRILRPHSLTRPTGTFGGIERLLPVGG